MVAYRQSANMWIRVVRGGDLITIPRERGEIGVVNAIWSGREISVLRLDVLE